MSDADVPSRAPPGKTCTALLCDVDNGGRGAGHGWGQGACEESLYLPLSFVVKLKLL